MKTRSDKKRGEIMGLDHPKMTAAIAARLLPKGVLIPIDALIRMSEIAMSHPMKATAEMLMKELNNHLDEQLRAAQERASS